MTYVLISHEQQTAANATIDPITRSVVQHRLSSIVKEMGEAMLRTAYSQILNSSRDFSIALIDAPLTLFLPLATVFIEALSKGFAGLVDSLSDPETQSSIRLTLIVAGLGMAGLLPDAEPVVAVATPSPAPSAAPSPSPSAAPTSSPSSSSAPTRSCRISTTAPR